MALERLQKIIAAAGITSRRKAEELIQSGVVSVNGQTITELGTKADLETDSIRVNDKLLKGAERHEYLALNKPRGYVTTVSDPEGRPTVMEFVRSNARLYPIGRLDFNSEGLLLLTNDGDLAYKLMKAASHIPKTYLVKVAGQPAEEQLRRLRAGVTVAEERDPTRRVRTAPAQIRVIKEADNPWLEVTLHEGRNRQIRKMFEEIGHHVEKIRRVRYGPLELDVPPGESRSLTFQEVARLKQATEPQARPPFPPRESKSRVRRSEAPRRDFKMRERKRQEERPTEGKPREDRPRFSTGRPSPDRFPDRDRERRPGSEGAKTRYSKPQFARDRSENERRPGSAERSSSDRFSNRGREGGPRSEGAAKPRYAKSQFGRDRRNDQRPRSAGRFEFPRREDGKSGGEPGPGFQGERSAQGDRRPFKGSDRPRKSQFGRDRRNDQRPRSAGRSEFPRREDGKAGGERRPGFQGERNAHGDRRPFKFSDRPRKREGSSEGEFRGRSERPSIEKPKRFAPRGERPSGGARFSGPRVQKRGNAGAKRSSGGNQRTPNRGNRGGRS